MALPVTYLTALSQLALALQIHHIKSSVLATFSRSGAPSSQTEFNWSYGTV
jgi:hypothetical protein